MKIVGELKNKVEKTQSNEEAKKLIKEAGFEINDEELDEISGGLEFMKKFEVHSYGNGGRNSTGWLDN